jgi:hypothetical protein
MEYYRGPQRHTVQSKVETGESEDDGDGGIVNQQRRDQSFCGPALCVTSRKPTCDTQRK